jgi:hypothetical protein
MDTNAKMGSGPSRMLAWLCALALAASAARAQEAAPELGFPGMALQARVERYARSQQAAWKADLPHYALVFPIDSGDLDAYMAQVLLRFDGRDVVLGSAEAVEAHAGGLLAFLLANWRPNSRAPALTDRFWFASNRSRVALSQIYQAHEHQIFLPVPARTTDAIDGKLPQTPQLARMQLRYRAPAGGVVSQETDAYSFLRLLAEREADLSRTWVNHLGQTLSADRLLSQAWEHYVARREPDDELADHSKLHLVEVLLAFSRRRAASGTPGAQPLDPNQIKRRFLAVELRRTDFSRDDWELRVGHYLESLGHLLDEPRVEWLADEKRQVRNWLRRLDRSSDHDLAGVEVAHFVKGLRAIAAQQAKLADPAP